MKRQKIHT